MSQRKSNFLLKFCLNSVKESMRSNYTSQITISNIQIISSVLRALVIILYIYSVIFIRCCSMEIVLSGTFN